MNYLSSMEAAKVMGITVRRVQQMCKQGEISGAVKKGHSWLIPENAVWPDSGEKKKPMPIGISDFKTATTSYYYVDKTDTLDAVCDFNYLLAGDYHCNLKNENITRYVKFNTLKTKDISAIKNENKLVKNKTQYER